MPTRAQLCAGLQHLHAKRIVHRDIKSLNVLLGADNELKICDLGGSRLLTSGALLGGKVGTPLYLAPEVLQCHPYDTKADIWSLGCLVYTLVTRLPPFLGRDSLDLSGTSRVCVVRESCECECGTIISIRKRRFAQSLCIITTRTTSYFRSSARCIFTMFFKKKLGNTILTLIFSTLIIACL